MDGCIGTLLWACGCVYLCSCMGGCIHAWAYVCVCVSVSVCSVVCHDGLLLYCVNCLHFTTCRRISGLHPSEQDPVLGSLLFDWCIWELLGILERNCPFWDEWIFCWVTVNWPFHSCEQPTLFIKCVDIWQLYTGTLREWIPRPSHSCEHPVHKVRSHYFDCCVHVPWGNKYPDPVTPVNSLFTKCVHIILTFIYMYLSLIHIWRCRR